MPWACCLALARPQRPRCRRLSLTWLWLRLWFFCFAATRATLWLLLLWFLFLCGTGFRLALPLWCWRLVLCWLSHPNATRRLHFCLGLSRFRFWGRRCCRSADLLQCRSEFAGSNRWELLGKKRARPKSFRSEKGFRKRVVFDMAQKCIPSYDTVNTQ